MSELEVASEMEVECANKNVMASAGTVGSVSVSLHTLVIMNISEHWTRLRAQEGKVVPGKSFLLIPNPSFNNYFSVWSNHRNSERTAS